MRNRMFNRHSPCFSCTRKTAHPDEVRMRRAEPGRAAPQRAAPEYGGLRHPLEANSVFGSMIVPADGTGAANWKKSRPRYVAPFVAAETIIFNCPYSHR